MNAVISGHSGIALLIEGNALSSIQFGENEVRPRKPSDLRLLFNGARDLQLLEDVDLEEVRKRLDLESTRIDALHLALILLDCELADDTRKAAAEELEELLTDEAIVRWVESVLYAHPLPRSGDLMGARSACTGRTQRTREFLEKLGSLQPVVGKVHEAWERIPADLFGSEQDRAFALTTAVREGLFRDLVMQLVNQATSKEALLSGGITNVSWQKVQRHGAILREWISAVREGERSFRYPESATERSAVAESKGYKYSFPRGRHVGLSEHPTYSEIDEFLLRPERARGASIARIVRHLLAECPICYEQVLAVLAPPELSYDEAFAGANRALSDFFAREKPSNHPAEVLLQELAPLPEAEQLQRIGSGRFASPELVRCLIEDSRSNRYADTGRMLHLAHLARLAANSCSVQDVGSKTRLSDLRSRAWGNFGHSLRVSGRLSEAEVALTTARGYLEEGTRDPLLRAGLLEQIASLRISQGRYPEAHELTDEAAEIYREIGHTHDHASALVQNALACHYMGMPEEAIRVLNRAIPLIESEQNPHLLLAACHNLVVSYIALEQPEQALSLYFEIRDLYKEFEDDLILLRTGWQEGQLLRDLGHLHAAETALLQVRRGFAERNLAHEVAMVSLDLAWVYVKLGWFDSLQQTVAEAIPIFTALRVGREALSALLQLQHSAGQEMQALEIIGFINKRISRGSSAPDLPEVRQTHRTTPKGKPP